MEEENPAEEKPPEEPSEGAPEEAKPEAGAPEGEKPEEAQQEGERPARPMWDAVCSKCGQPCQVPFEPQEGRPVYCRNCYRPRRRF